MVRNIPLEENNPLPERIREARLARGMSQPELAEVLGITRQAISQYENGTSRPRPEIIQIIQDCLDFPIQYFFKDFAYFQRGAIQFRKFRTAKEKNEGLLRVRILWMGEILSYLMTFLDFPEVNVLRKNEEEYSFEEINNIASELRKKWDLGSGPISNLALLLENHGFIISKIKIEKRKLDACSTINTQEGAFRPMILLTSDKSAVRSRFDLAHELGHVILHSWVDEEYLANKENHKRVEAEANTFAGAFLVPSEALHREARNLTSINSYVSLKKRWKVSIQALIRRCYDLDYISDNQYQYLQRQISMKRYKTKEPLDDVLVHEEPSVLKKAIELLLENKIQTVDSLKEKIALPLSDLSMLCDIDPGIFKKTSQPHLRLIKGGRTA